MAETQQNSPKKRLSIDQYLKVKEKRANDKLKLHLPNFVKVIVIIPTVYLVFLIIYFLMHIRQLPEH